MTIKSILRSFVRAVRACIPRKSKANKSPRCESSSQEKNRLSAVESTADRTVRDCTPSNVSSEEHSSSVACARRASATSSAETRNERTVSEPTTADTRLAPMSPGCAVSTVEAKDGVDELPTLVPLEKHESRIDFSAILLSSTILSTSSLFTMKPSASNPFAPPQFRPEVMSQLYQVARSWGIGQQSENPIIAKTDNKPEEWSIDAVASAEKLLVEANEPKMDQTLSTDQIVPVDTLSVRGFNAGFFCPEFQQANISDKSIETFQEVTDEQSKVAYDDSVDKTFKAVTDLLKNIPIFSTTIRRLNELGAVAEIPRSSLSFSCDPLKCLNALLWGLESRGIFVMGRVPIMQTVLVREDGFHDLSNVISISIDLKKSTNDQVVETVGDLLVNHLKGGKKKFLLAPPMLLIHFGQTIVNPPPGFENTKIASSSNHQVAMKQSLTVPPEVQCELKGRASPKTVSYTMTGFIKESSFQFYFHKPPKSGVSIDRNVALVAFQRKSQ